jgi:hypothetical protein
MESKSKKATQQLTMQKIIVLTLVVMVVIFVLYFLFTRDITGWIKNLPGYSSPNDTVVDMTTLSEEEKVQYGCSEMVGAVNSKEADWKYGDVRRLSVSIDGIGIESKIFVDASSSPYKLQLREEHWYNDKEFKIGSVDVASSLITLDANFLKEYPNNVQYQSMISREELIILNGSHLRGARYLCKTQAEVLAQEKAILQVIKDMKGASGMLKMKFTDGTNDDVKIIWNFGTSKAMIVLNPNGKTIPTETCNAFFDNSAISCLSHSLVKSDMYDKDTTDLTLILNAVSAEDLAKQIASALSKNTDFEHAALGRNVNEHSFNSILYGLFKAPTIKREAYLNYRIINLEKSVAAQIAPVSTVKK